LDLVANKLINTVHLTRQMKLELRARPTEGIDGCLANDAIYDSRAAIFYTVAPLQERDKSDGTKDYRLLGFEVPSLRMISNTSLGSNLNYVPRLVFEQGTVRALRSVPRPGADIHISDFSPHDYVRILEMSGDKAVVQILQATETHTLIGLIDIRKRTLLRIDNNIKTSPFAVHLTPGGMYVVVKETSGGNAQKKQEGWPYMTE